MRMIAQKWLDEAQQLADEDGKEYIVGWLKFQSFRSRPVVMTPRSGRRATQRELREDWRYAEVVTPRR